SHFAMFRLALMPKVHDRRQHIVPVGKHIRLRPNHVAGDALRRKASAIDRGRNTFDHDTSTSIETGLRHESASCELHALLPGGEKRAASGFRIVDSEQAAIRSAVAA